MDGEGGWSRGALVDGGEPLPGQLEKGWALEWQQEEEAELEAGPLLTWKKDWVTLERVCVKLIKDGTWLLFSFSCSTLIKIQS